MKNVINSDPRFAEHDPNVGHLLAAFEVTGTIGDKDLDTINDHFAQIVDGFPSPEQENVEPKFGFAIETFSDKPGKFYVVIWEE